MMMKHTNIYIYIEREREREMNGYIAERCSVILHMLIFHSPLPEIDADSDQDILNTAMADTACLRTLVEKLRTDLVIER